MDNSLQYNFLDNNFTTFENVETPKVTIEFPLGNMDVSDKFESVSSTGIPIVKKEESLGFINNNPEYTNSSLNYDVDNSSIDSLSFKELAEQENLPIIITSGYRQNSTTTSGSKSHHSEKDSRGNPRAYDIKPQKGYSFDDLRKILYNNPKVVRWFKAHNMGILEEMMDGKRGFYDTEGKFHYTKATGPHFHIGPDKYAVEWYNNKIRKGQKGFKIPYTIFQNVELPEQDSNTVNFLDSKSEQPRVTNYSTENTQEQKSSKSFINNNQEYTSLNSSSIYSNSPGQKLNSSDVVQFFKSKGLSEEQARGIVGNLMQESKLNPKAVGDGGRSYGIAQWNGTRLQGLINFAQRKKTSTDDLNTQLEYIWEELNSTEKTALRALKSSSNIRQATTTFMKYYERPGNPKLEKRIQFAETL